MKRIRYRLYEHSIVLPWSEANESMAKRKQTAKPIKSRMTVRMNPISPLWQSGWQSLSFFSKS